MATAASTSTGAVQDKYSVELAADISRIMEGIKLGNKRALPMFLAKARKVFDNYDLYTRFEWGCKKIYMDIGQALYECKDDEYLVYVEELDLYGLCPKDKIGRLASTLKDDLPPLGHCDDAFNRDVASQLCNGPAQSAPKSTIHLVINGDKPHKLVFYCRNPTYFHRIKKALFDKWEMVSTMLRTLNDDVLIAVDTVFTNQREARQFYNEIIEVLITINTDIAVSLRPIFPYASILPAYLIPLGMGDENIKSSIDALYDRPAELHQIQPAIPKDPGTIYCLSNPAMPGLYKVGLTRREINVRMSELYATGVPSRFVVVHSVRVNDCAASERAIHEELTKMGARYNGDREFFKVDPNMIIAMMNKQLAR